MHSSATIQTSALTVAQKRSLETFYQAFSNKNPSLLDEAVTPDWQDIPLAPGQAPGPEGMKPLMQMFFTALPDVQIIIDDVIAQPNRAGVRARMLGTHQGEIFGLQPTGKPVSIALHEFHHFDHDRISHTWHLEDWFGMLHQIGAWPPASRPR
ncbi:ester cyclase [Phormidium sp. FACHB-592]|uniref:Ester cyclase n=1 Tax=Stenomitos frigidus AS-A4 TaxID=2933935 RepID=A0ABV0KTS5_9CYAN|nr:ester cyclase [Phormidium sp. FACHB-592]MBD2077192.1 ester cyclase [Phormidium sp. FACHB-592]